MDNPLLEESNFPQFEHIRPEHAEPAVDYVLKHCRDRLDHLLKQKEFTWDDLMAPLDEMGEMLHRACSPVSHIYAVTNSDAWRDAYNACLPKLTEYHVEMGQNFELYKAIKNLSETETSGELNPIQDKIIKDTLRDFHLAGVDLPEKSKKQYAKLSQELSKLCTKFSDNILDATDAWNLLVEDEEILHGIPEHALHAAEARAKEEGKTGWMFNLEYPCFHAIVTYADNRELRETFYDAYVTRASDEGPNAGKWDNSQIMVDIIKNRYEMAKLLKFSHYTELSLATKMAADPQEVFSLLNDIASRAKIKAEKELLELQQYAASLGADELEPWDMSYYSEKLLQEKYSVNHEELRPYFPESKVLNGLFEVTHILFNVTIKEVKDVQTWHKDVRFFEITDENNKLVGHFYLDLYARP